MKSFGVLVALLAVSFAYAADFVAPKLTGPVVDEVGLLSSSEQSKIETLLRTMHAQGAEKGIQMNIVIPTSLQGLEIEEYGIKLAEAWKLGQSKTDRGLILIVAPEERAMRLEVGYGLEGELPDARAKQILDNTLKPFFRASRFGDGLLAAIYEISERTGIDLSSAEVAKPSRRTAERRSGGGFSGGDLWKLFLFLAFFAGIKRLAMVLGGGAIGYFAAMVTGIFAPMLGLLLGAFGGLVLGLLLIRGGFSSGHVLRGGRGRGGFGGGGFGSWGGGGGGFGGGGASSRW